MRTYAAASVAATTRRTYSSAVQQYRGFCRSRGWSDAAASVSELSVAEWLAHRADSGEVSAATLQVYRSAISTWRATETVGAPGPDLAGGAVKLVLKGIERKLAEADAERRKERGSSDELTAPLLASLRTVLLPLGAGDDALMIWAAAHVGVHALLRPNELLGTKQLRSRALTVHQVTFRDAQQHDVPVDATNPLPDSVQIRLGTSKTDQLGVMGVTKHFAARSAVAALWQWMLRRLELGAPRPEALPTADARDALVFRVPGQPPLSVARLTSTLEAALCKRHPERQWNLTGRTYRRGGASDLAAAGAPAADVAAAGGWRSVRMFERYTSEAARVARQLAVSRAMDTPSSSAL